MAYYSHPRHLDRDQDYGCVGGDVVHDGDVPGSPRSHLAGTIGCMGLFEVGRQQQHSLLVALSQDWWLIQDLGRVGTL